MGSRVRVRLRLRLGDSQAQRSELTQGGWNGMHVKMLFMYGPQWWAKVMHALAHQVSVGRNTCIGRDRSCVRLCIHRQYTLLLLLCLIVKKHFLRIEPESWRKKSLRHVAWRFWRVLRKRAPRSYRTFRLLLLLISFSSFFACLGLSMPCVLDPGFLSSVERERIHKVL